MRPSALALRTPLPWPKHLPRSLGHPGLAHGELFAQSSAAPHFARLFIVFAFPQFPGDAAPLQEFLETPQSHADRFAIRGRASVKTFRLLVDRFSVGSVSGLHF